MILVTGGCGFIGSNFVYDWLAHENEPICVIDKLTYAGNLANLQHPTDATLVTANQHPNFTFVHGDITNQTLIESLFQQYHPRAILNFAAETHVDRSIDSPKNFINTNINGTFYLLETTRNYWNNLNAAKKNAFRFLQVSTDEVYGSLTKDEAAFTETRAYAPKNPYSATKAAADHLVNAYHATYGLPTLISNCSNNYGPFQYPEKLIPFTLFNALQGKPILIYGDGLQIRDWLYVGDHCTALRKVLSAGIPGESYNIGGNSEKTNLSLVTTLCEILDELKPATHSYASLITHIKDRPGHDRRYAINAQKISEQLHWQPRETFESGIRKTIEWYLENFSQHVAYQID